MNEERIVVIGYFGLKNNQLDGQTIKTRNVFKLLKSKEDQIGAVTFFDTQRFQQNKFSVFVMFLNVLKAKKIVYLPAHNNLKYIFPFLFLICTLLGIRIIYIVVGGWLYEYLRNKPFHRFLLKKIAGIFPQTTQLVENLNKKYHFGNVIHFPNFRIQSFHPEFKKSNESFRIVFMARINNMKGIDTVFKIADYFEHSMMGNRAVEIDFYGQIDDNDKENFLENIKNHPCTKYKGSLAPDEIYTTLSCYDVMVLPTRYYTEGFPGSILDAYISGIPVVVTNWKHATEFVSQNETGFIVPFENGENDFIKAVSRLYFDGELLNKMKYKAYEKSKEYSSERGWEIIKPYLT